MAGKYTIKLKSEPEYIKPDPSNKGGPKYGHYAEIDPAFASMKDAADAAVADVWQYTDWEKFRDAWKQSLPLPDDCPKPGEDVSESYLHVTVRDGAKVEIKIMKSVKTTGDKSVLILRTHGGGWAIGWHGTEAIENLHAAAIPNVVLVSVDYRLAPEYPYPYAVNDTFDVLKWCKANFSSLGIDPARIILMGGSAGSNLAIAVTLMAKDQGVTGIIGQVLDWPTSCHPKFFPMVKDKYELESYNQCHDASVVDPIKMEFFLDAYTPGAKPDPYHSPLLAKSCKGLPPAFIQVAGLDPLRDEGLAFAEKLKADGVPVELHVYKGLPHCFSMLFTNLPQAKDYQARQDAWVRKMVG